jgi:hypothetical protein
MAKVLKPLWKKSCMGRKTPNVIDKTSALEFLFSPSRESFTVGRNFNQMKYFLVIVTLLFSFQGFTQVIPNVSIDSLTTRLFPVYFEAVKSGIFDLPRDTSWQNLKKYESESILLQVPSTWLNLGGLGSVVEVGFDGSGLYFPETLNAQPILVGLFVLNQRGTSLEAVKDSAVKDYRTNQDRIFEKGYSDSVYNFNLSTGEKGYVLHTRFFRKSNKLNQSRYDLILFSKKFNKGYSVMVSIQYSDPTYSFEKTNELNVFAARLFNRVLLK